MKQHNNEAIALPSPSDEAWKYTRLAPIAARLGVDWWQPSSSTIAAPRSLEGVEAINLATEKLPDAVSCSPSQQPASTSKAFTATLNAACSNSGTCITIANSAVLATPLLLMHGEGEGAHYDHHTLHIGAGAALTLIEVFSADQPQIGLCSHNLHITMEPNAQLTHYRLQQHSSDHFHLGLLEINQQRDTCYQLHTVELGGSISRLDITTNLNQPGASCDLHGLFLLSGNQHVDHHITINHVAPHCQSRADYRTVLDGRSHAVFNGKVVVHKGAIKTDSMQNNANLLLSKRAQIDTKPELEIYNDDVQCAHGATVGQLDNEQLFYLQSRGLSEAEARELLVTAFAEAVLMSINNSNLRQHIEQAAIAKLPNG